MFKPQKMTSAKPIQEEAGLLTGLHTFNMQSVSQKLYNRGGHIKIFKKTCQMCDFVVVFAVVVVALFLGWYCIQ